MGGDVILMTGVGLAHTAEFLNHIVRQAVEGEAACLIIWLCDDLIAQIPPETAALADELRLPLLTAPWDTHIAGLIGEISTRILTDQYGENAMNELLEMLLFQREPVPEELMAAFVEKYRLTGRHLVAAAECRWESGGDGEGPMGELPSRRQVNSLIIQSLKSAFPQTYYISRNWNPVFLLRLEKRQEAALREVLLAVREKAARDYPRLEVRFGVGGAQQLPRGRPDENVPRAQDDPRDDVYGVADHQRPLRRDYGAGAQPGSAGQSQLGRQEDAQNHHGTDAIKLAYPLEFGPPQILLLGKHSRNAD